LQQKCPAQPHPRRALPKTLEVSCHGDSDGWELLGFTANFMGIDVISSGYLSIENPHEKPQT